MSDLEKEIMLNWESFKYNELPLPIGAITKEADDKVKDFLLSSIRKAREEGEKQGQAKMNNSGRLLFQQGYQQGMKEMLDIIQKHEGWEESYKFYEQFLK